MAVLLVGTVNTTSNTGTTLAISTPAITLATGTNGWAGVRTEGGSVGIFSNAANSNGFTLDYAQGPALGTTGLTYPREYRLSVGSTIPSRPGRGQLSTLPSYLLMAMTFRLRLVSLRGSFVAYFSLYASVSLPGRVGC